MTRISISSLPMVVVLAACVPKSTDRHPRADSPTDSAADSDTGRPDSSSDSDSVPDSHTDSPPDSDTDSDSGPDTQPDTDTAPPDSGEPDRAMEFLLIAASTFEMGCTPSQDCVEGAPIQTVTLTHDYYVLSTEVTQGWYEDLIGETPSSFDECGRDCPVDDVSWHDGAKFANALSAAEGLEECYTCDTGSPPFCEVTIESYDCQGYRLLTEAEWEGAARCGTDLAYSGSDDADPVAWYHSNSGAGPQPIATLAPNACGLYDMSGNVEEWVEDVYGEYSTEPVTDPVDEDEPAEFRVARGGSYRREAEYSRVSCRYFGQPYFYSNNLGFRVGRTAP